MGTWWERSPDVLDEELSALRDAGIPFTVDPRAQAEGILALDADVPLSGGSLPVRVVYPDLFPYFRFEVYAPTLELPRHQHPFSKNLCLIGRATENWDVDGKAADFLITQLPKLLETADIPADSPAEGEEQQGEPVSDYYFTQPGAILLVESRWEIPDDVTAGILNIRLSDRPVSVIGAGDSAYDGPIIRGVIDQVSDDDGHILAEADAGLRNVVGDGEFIEGRWLRVDALPLQADPPTVLRHFEEVAERVHARRPIQRYAGRFRLDVTGFLFREEVGYREWADGWLFLVRTWRGRSPAGIVYLAKAGRAGKTDLAERVPEVSGLSSKSVAVIGLGGIGAPVALELARAGIGELRLVDFDRVEAGTAVRWPFGIEAAGRAKVEVIAEWIAKNLPYTSVRTLTHRIGAVRTGHGERSDHQAFDFIFEHADMVIDATAEIGVHYPLAMAARQRGVQYIEVSTRAGAWGGVIARIGSAAESPCWMCYQLSMEDWRSAGILAPSADPSGLRQPTGCADPTFTGAGFDIAHYALSCVRVAVGSLLAGSEGSYPSPNWDVAVSNLRDNNGGVGEPVWTTRTLSLHDRCPLHEKAG